MQKQNLQLAAKFGRLLKNVQPLRVRALLVCALAGWLVLDGALANEALWSRGLHFQTEGDVVPLAEDGIHDPTNQAVVKVLQEPVEAMADFPRDDKGIIDWVRVLEEGYIDPRQSLTGEEEMYTADFDIIFTNTGSMPNVRFPHKPHTEWLTCANCHPAIFLPQKGGNPITMSAIIQGKYCGVCHGKVAFPPTMNCGRCHSVPRKSPGLR
jgi:c(7)-type cytochrome triheme protein